MFEIKQLQLLSSITLDEPTVYCYNDLSLDEHR
jgi:hypothetical protein